ncbi:MAG: NUDIX hydrolase [Spirochaetales bacterium]|nr:NUDIX hydrolase [Spirochaetales bacterium]
MYKPVKTTVGAVIEGARGVLLALRNHPPFDGYWCLPGGHIEFGEEVETALFREIQEETGLTVTGHRFLGYFNEYFPDLDWHAVALMFVVHVEGAESRQESEVRELRWFSHAELRNMKLAFKHGEVVRQYLAGL